MPKAGEKVIPVNMPEEAADDLQKIMETSGMRQADVLRYTLVAALRTLAEKNSVTLPIQFTVNGEHKKGK